MTDVATAASLRRNRDFHLMWTGGMLAGLGSLIGNLAIPLLVLRETGSAAKAGLVGSVSVAALLIASIPAGAVVDTVERRRLVIGCQLAGAVLAAVLATAVLAGYPALSLIMFTTAAVAVLSSVYTPAVSALLRAAVPTGQLGLALSRFQARTAATQIAGPLAGGALFSLSPALPFSVRAAALLGSVGCLAAVRTRSAPERTGAGVLSPTHLLAGVRFVWRQRYLRVVLVVFGGGLSCAFSAVMLVALLTSARIDPSGRSSGVLVAVTSAGSLAGALLAPRLRAGDRPSRVLLLTCWSAAAIVPVLAVTDSPMVMGVLLGAVLGVAAVGNVAFDTELIRRTPNDLVGRTEAGSIFLSVLVQPLGPLAGGLLVDRFGSALAFVILGAVAAALAGTLTVLLPRCS